MSQFNGRKRREFEEALQHRELEQDPAQRTLTLKRVQNVLSSLAFKKKRLANAGGVQRLRHDLFVKAQQYFTAGMSLEAAKERSLAECEVLSTQEKAGFSIFADLAKERRLDAVALEASHQTVIETANAMLLKKLLRECLAVKLFFDGNVKNIVKLAKLKGLVCTLKLVQKSTNTSDSQRQLDSFQNFVHVSGPLSLFHQTPIYGSALYALFSQLCYAHRYVAQIVQMRQGKETVYTVQAGDPIKPGKVPKVFDSRLERRFAREFARRFPLWELIREPKAFELENGTIIFPDFLLRHRHVQAEVLLEVVGYWTEEYFESKLTQFLQLHARVLAEHRPLKIVLAIDCRFEDSVVLLGKELPLQVFYFQEFIDLENLAGLLVEDPV